MRRHLISGSNQLAEELLILYFHASTGRPRWQASPLEHVDLFFDWDVNHVMNHDAAHVSTFQ